MDVIQDEQETYRWWTRPTPEKDEYGVFIVRYHHVRIDRHLVDGQPAEVITFKSASARAEYLDEYAHWIEYAPGEVIHPFLTFEGRHVNPFVATVDWREAVANVVEHHIRPLVEELLGSPFITGERNE